MSKFFLCEIENIEKSGVEIKVTGTRIEKDDDDCIRTVRTVCFDFSEHDKVFEDKIAKLQEEVGKLNQDNMRLERKCVTKDDEIYRLKKDYETVSELLGKYQQENESLKQRIAELEQSKSKWIDRVVEWQQKCEKLESKETESLDEVPDSITIDGYKCKIIKTESGLYISRDEIYSIIDKGKEPLKQKCKELEDRHQSDCIEINRLNMTIDVLIHKVEYLRQFAGLK